MYYGLQNFYQNHRRYALSRSDEQLLGRNVDVSFFFLCIMRSVFLPGVSLLYGDLSIL